MLVWLSSGTVWSAKLLAWSTIPPPAPSLYVRAPWHVPLINIDTWLLTYNSGVHEVDKGSRVSRTNQVTIFTRKREGPITSTLKFSQYKIYVWQKFISNKLQSWLWNILNILNLLRRNYNNNIQHSKATSKWSINCSNSVADGKNQVLGPNEFWDEPDPVLRQTRPVPGTNCDLSASNRATWCDSDLRFEFDPFKSQSASDLKGSALWFCCDLKRGSNHKLRDLKVRFEPLFAAICGNCLWSGSAIWNQ